MYLLEQFKQNFIEIWTSEKAKISRKNLYEAKRNFAPCNVCDVEGTLMGRKNSEYYSKMNVKKSGDSTIKILFARRETFF